MTDHPTTAPEAREKRVPIEDQKLRIAVISMQGLQVAREILIEQGEYAQGLAGMKLALTLIERESAALTANVHRRLVPMIAAAGVDLATWQAWSFTELADAVICRPIEDTVAGLEPSAN